MCVSVSVSLLATGSGLNSPSTASSASASTSAFQCHTYPRIGFFLANENCGVPNLNSQRAPSLRGEGVNSGVVHIHVQVHVHVHMHTPRPHPR